jgi:hypothetical protein
MPATTFSISIDISASPAAVWTVMKDIERWHEWTPSIKGIRQMTKGPFRKGTIALVRQPGLPAAIWKVTELREDEGFAWISRGPGLCVTGRHWIERLQGTSRVTLSIEYAGLLAWLMVRLTRRLNERYIAMEANGLKMRCEAPH